MKNRLKPTVKNKHLLAKVKAMKVIFAQGNPGTTYADSRHNVGFMALDHLAKEWGANFQLKSKFQADIAELTKNGEKILLVKPQTFYNETGRAARALIDFYKLDPAQDFLVIHDELALPFATLRIREKGSDAGNNGIKSLNHHIGPDYTRIRIGIYNSTRDQIDDADFVLASFTSDEKTALPAMYQQVERFVIDFINGSLEPTKVTTLRG